VIHYALCRDETLTVHDLANELDKAGLKGTKPVTIKIGYADTIAVLDAIREAGRLKPLPRSSSKGGNHYSRRE
jgi:hypothetical protein